VLTMSRTLLLLLAAGAAILAVVVLIVFSRAGDEETVLLDLVELFPEAEKRTDVTGLEMAFDVAEVAIDTQSHRSIYAHPSSRIIWTVTVPPGAALETWFAVRPDAWELSADGVQFRIGISHDGVYDEFLREHVHPRERASDRRWHTVVVPLHPFQGRTVQIIFNTDKGPRDSWDATADFAVWGAPRIVASPR